MKDDGEVYRLCQCFFCHFYRHNNLLYCFSPLLANRRQGVSPPHTAGHCEDHEC